MSVFTKHQLFTWLSLALTCSDIHNYQFNLTQNTLTTCSCLKIFHNQMAGNDGSIRCNFWWCFWGAFSAHFLSIWMRSKNGVFRHLTPNVYRQENNTLSQIKISIFCISVQQRIFSDLSFYFKLIFKMCGFGGRNCMAITGR